MKSEDQRGKTEVGTEPGPEPSSFRLHPSAFKRRVVVTGLGLITPIGTGLERFTATSGIGIAGVLLIGRED